MAKYAWVANMRLVCSRTEQAAVDAFHTRWTRDIARHWAFLVYEIAEDTSFPEAQSQLAAKLNDEIKARFGPTIETDIRNSYTGSPDTSFSPISWSWSYGSDGLHESGTTPVQGQSTTDGTVYDWKFVVNGMDVYIRVNVRRAYVNLDEQRRR
jgi:hypothetical protein